MVEVGFRMKGVKQMNMVGKNIYNLHVFEIY